MTVEEIIIELKAFSQNHGLSEVEPILISKSANLIVRLFPYDIVARVAIHDSKTKKLKNNIIREIDVVKHLYNCSVPVINPSGKMFSGPYELSKHWFSLWRYEEKDEDIKLTPDMVIRTTLNMMEAIKMYPHELPVLSVWDRIESSATNLMNKEDQEVKQLIDQYLILDNYIRNIEECALEPSHGDSHIKNLFPSRGKWRWMDFEDVSLMPKYWDIASMISNVVLFKGLDIPLVQLLLEDKNLIQERNEFFMILKARIVMSIIGNLDMALRNMGDLGFAEMQLKRYEGVFDKIDKYIKTIN